MALGKFAGWCMVENALAGPAQTGVGVMDSIGEDTARPFKAGFTRQHRAFGHAATSGPAGIIRHAALAQSAASSANVLPVPLQSSRLN